MARSIKVALELDNKQFNRAIKDSDKQVDKFEKSTSSSLKAVGGAFAAIGGAALIKEIVTIGQSFQDLQTSLNFVTGSSQAGADAFDNLTRLATQTQFGVEELVQTFIRLKGAGIEPTNDLLLTFADTASLAQDQLGVLTSLTELFARGATKGKLELEDFNKIAERGVDVFRPLTKEFGMSIDQIKKLAETPKGQERLFAGIQKALDDTYGGALVEKLKNSSVAFSNLEIALRRLADSTFKELGLNSTSAIESLTTAINNLADSGETINNVFKTLGAIVLFIVNPFGKLKLAYQAVTKAGGGLIGSLRNMIVHKKLSGEAVKNLTSLFERFISVIGGQGILAAYKMFTGSADEGTESLEEQSEALKQQEEKTKKAAEAAEKLAAEISELSSVAQSFVANDYRTELEKITDRQDTARQALFDLRMAFVKSNGDIENYTKLLAAVKNEIIAANRAYDDYNESLKDPAPETFAEFVKRMDKALLDYNTEQKHATQLLKEMNEAIALGHGDAETFAFVIERLNEILGITKDKVPTEEFENFNDIVEDIQKSTTNYNLLLETLTDLLANGKINAEQFAEAKANLDQAFTENEGLNNFLETLGTAQKALSEDLANAFLEGENAGTAFKDFFKKMIQSIIADIIRLSIIQPILSAIMAPFGFGFGTGGSVIKLPGKASGGPVMPGGAYLVGERGPEVLQMGSQGGNIIPNNKLGGGATAVTYNINAVDARSFKQLVAEDPEFIYSVSRAGQRRLPA